MNMKEFLKKTNPGDRSRIAEESGTTVAYFWQIAGSHRKPSALLARRISKASNGEITPAELRPDIFGEPVLDSEI